MDLPIPSQEQESLRDKISSAFDSVVESTDVQKEVTPVEVRQDVSTEKPRDVQGKFVPKEAKDSVSEPIVQEKQLTRPTHWKKEYLPIWDKLYSGESLSPEESKKLAAYSNQREGEFASGVSTYRAEAERSKELHEAIAPFLPDLQQNNINPSQWIKSLGIAHQTLVRGSPEQKLQMFAKLAADYGVNLGVFSGQQQNPMTDQMLQQINNLSGQVNTFANWQKQEEQRQAEQMLSKFNDVDQFPHYEEVRGTMAELLLSGLAKDPDEAYAKAVRLNDSAWSAEQDRQNQAKASKEASIKQAAVAKAKSNAVSVKSVTPSGTQNGGAKDRRSLLEQHFNSFGEGRL